MKGPRIERKAAARRRDRLVGMGMGIGCMNSQGRAVWFGFWGHVEKCALTVAFDRVIYAARRCSWLRPRRPDNGDGFNPSDVTKRVRLGFGFGFGSGLGHGS